jgi:hypothetical protein
LTPGFRGASCANGEMGMTTPKSITISARFIVISFFG